MQCCNRIFGVSRKIDRGACHNVILQRAILDEIQSFIGQRRGAGLLGSADKVGRRDGELKTYWTEPAGLAGELLYGR